MTLTKGHIAKVKVTVYIMQKLFPDHYLSQVTWMGAILHTIVVHYRGLFLGVGVGGICPVKTCLIDSFIRMLTVWYQNR